MTEKGIILSRNSLYLGNKAIEGGVIYCKYDGNFNLEGVEFR